MLLKGTRAYLWANLISLKFENRVLSKICALSMNEDKNLLVHDVCKPKFVSITRPFLPECMAVLGFKNCLNVAQLFLSSSSCCSMPSSTCLRLPCGWSWTCFPQTAVEVRGGEMDGVSGHTQAPAPMFQHVRLQQVSCQLWRRLVAGIPLTDHQTGDACYWHNELCWRWTGLIV